MNDLGMYICITNLTFWYEEMQKKRKKTYSCYSDNSSAQHIEKLYYSRKEL